MDGLLYDIACVGAREPDCVWLGDAAAAGPPAAPFAPGPFGLARLGSGLEEACQSDA